MSVLFGARLNRYREAYLAMARSADYRPQAPGDGFGHVYLSREEAADPVRLDREASAYAHAFNAEEDGCEFRVGVSNFDTNRAFIWTIEAARALCSGASSMSLALDLLTMAVEEVATQARAQKIKKVAR